MRDLFLLLTICLAAFCQSVYSQEDVDFNRDIRPILSENCFHCHGPDAEQRAADLRLDEHEAALSVIEIRNPQESELFARVTSQDEDLRMPPVGSNRTLSQEQIDLLRRWIEQGAEWGQHWSWKPLSAPAVPQLEENRSVPVQNPIDAFIQYKLQTEGFFPAPEADKRTLIRRVTLDLTGLPPTVEEVDAFLNDESSQAYEKVVDRLLASPTYGERMAWDWLDAARYADSNGYQGDMERTMWPWRDWVIDAFNQNMPYDQFTIWQLAGDLLPDASFEQKLATGFCRNHMINGEGGRIAEENRVDYVMDMAETTGTLWLGLTFNCCRCHDHKFDPLTQKDYFSLFAFFNQTPVTGAGRDPQTKPVLAAPTADQAKQIADLEAERRKVQSALAARHEELAKQQAEWEQQQLKNLQQTSSWQRLTADVLQAEQQELVQWDDRSIFASGPNPQNDTYTVITHSDVRTITAVRLDALRHESHFQGGLARSDSGNFVLTEFEIWHLLNGEEKRLKINSATATYEQGSLKVTNAFDGNPKSGWAVYAGKPIDRDHSAVFRLDAALELEPDSQLKIILRHNSPHAHHNLGRFLLSVTSEPEPQLTEDAQQALRFALLTPPEKRTGEQTQIIRNAQQKSDPQSVDLAKQLDGADKRLTSARGKVAKVMVMEDQKETRPTFILDRGLYNSPGEEVQAAVPASLSTSELASAENRLDLAQWLVSTENPLTARVVVNRFWQQVFGIGLVKTPNDFGVQGEIPVHEDLLNWLAADFRESGWNVKRLMKQLVMSHTYRQTSKIIPALQAEDPENRLLGRAPRYRLPSWMLRDQALAASGLLTRTIGGPSVNVYQPPGIWEEATFGKKQYVQDHGDALYRRSLYIFWRRIIGPTIFFDNASRQTCTVDVFRTNTPLHALLTFNDVTYVEAARVLAQDVLVTVLQDDETRLNQVFQRTLARPCRPKEAEILLAGLQRSRETFAEHEEQARDLLAVGESPRDEKLNIVEHASWTSLCLAVLNLDETLTKE